MHRPPPLAEGVEDGTMPAMVGAMPLERRELERNIHEDGRGSDPHETGSGTGLPGMADRLDAIGGALSVGSVPGSGTTVSGQVPVATEATR